MLKGCFLLMSDKCIVTCIGCKDICKEYMIFKVCDYNSNSGCCNFMEEVAGLGIDISRILEWLKVKHHKHYVFLMITKKEGMW